MKWLLTAFFVEIASLVFSQGQQVSLNNVGWKEPETETPSTLAQLITANDTTDRQKVRSIFKWVTDNIEYNVKSFQHSGRAFSPDYWLEEEDDTATVLKPLNERVAAMVMKRKTAVCDGYARLFKILCDYAGVTCEVITGYGRTNINRIGAQFISNHKWNVVFIDSSWRLLDATWASGYINYRNEFERAYNSHYFLTPPETFILDHYPENLRWTLLPHPPTLKEFYNTPFKTSAYNTNYIKSFNPGKGVIEALVGDSITIEIETHRPKKSLWVTDISNVDTNTLFVLRCCGIGKPVNTIQGNKVSYTYKVTSDAVQWLHVIYDDEVIMRYKLNVRKEAEEQPAIKIAPEAVMH